jgi:hypothetical protein
MWPAVVSFVILIAVILVGIVPSAELLFAKADRLVRRLARPKAIVGAVFAGALAVAVFASTVIQWPVPRTHDEFAHLLAADTFRHGRLTNPPHELWQSFETFHVLQRPTYMSKFAPVPDFFLAFGWLVTGAPIAGAWLLHALACASVAWMLLAFIQKRWALLASVLLAFHPQMIDWSQSFWGGSTAVSGAALLLGGLERSARGNASSGWWAGVGLFLLAGSRPYEGFVLAVLLVVRWGLTVKGIDRVDLLKRATPLIVCGVVTLSFTGYYNMRVTESALAFPHRLYAKEYAPSPLFLGGKLAPEPEYRHEEMRRYHTGPEMAAFRLQSTPKGVAVAMLLKLKIVAEAAMRLPMTLGPNGPFKFVWWPVVLLLLLPAQLRRGRDRWVWGILAVFFSASFLVLWTQPHYAAPAVPLVVLGLAGLLQRARAFAFRWRGGRRLVVLIAGLMLASACTELVILRSSWDVPWDAAEVRQKMAEHLRELPGKDLVFVGYGPQHFLNFEWVYNEAGIDASEIVWARRMDPASNDRLIRYYEDRRVWLVDADSIPPRLIPLERPKEEHTNERREGEAGGELSN